MLSSLYQHCFHARDIHNQTDTRGNAYRALWPVWNTRNGRTLYRGLSQIFGGAITSATRTQSSWYYFPHPGNPP